MPTHTTKPSCLMNALSRTKKAAGVMLTGLSLSALSISSVVHAEPLATDAVGYIAGELDVSGGAASYSIPLAVPPGVAGMEPLLSINYSSQSGNGLLGLGWNLSGISLVHRCGSTLAQDGKNRAVKLDSQDNYCIDGKRLIPISGANGADGTEYRTEIDGFSKVVSYGVAGNGPAWFKVWTKSGQLMEFGNTADSRIEAQGKTTVLNYAVNKISDTSVAGNSIDFHYNEISANSEFVPTHISYGPNGQNKVEFTYSEITDLPASTLEGSSIKTSKRISKVETFANNQALQNWTFTFEERANKPAKLQALKLCTADGQCLPETTIGWNSFKPVTNSKPYEEIVDFNGDGIGDQLIRPSGTPYTQFLNLQVKISGVTTQTWKTGVRNISKPMMQFEYPELYTGDINGDGKTDVFTSLGDTYISTGSNFSDKGRHQLRSTLESFQNLHIKELHLNDFNGDGYSDLLRYFKHDQYAGIAFGNSNGTFSNTWEKLGDSIPYDSDSCSLYLSGSCFSGAPPEATCDIADINHDLSTDFKCTDGKIYLGSQEGFTYFSSLSAYQNHADTQLDMVTSISNNTTTSWEYASILDSTVYPNQAESNTYPNKELRGTYLIKSVTSENGIGGSRETTYQYGGAKVNQIGRGYLGFAWTEETDVNTGTKVRTEYNQSYPYIGMVSKSETFLADGTLINKAESQYTHSTSHNDKVYFPYVTTSTEQSFERDGALVTTISTENDQFDAYGNLGWVKVTTTGGGETYSKTTTNTYTNDETKWHLGRLLTATVSHEHADGTIQTRNSAFEYDPVTGFLNKEIVEPGTVMEVATTTTYDDHGNKVAVSTTAAGEATPRSASTTFDANGQFPVSSANALGHSDSKITDNRYGVLTSQTGPNGLTITWEYDGFGNRSKETRADGTVSTVSRHWVNSGQCAYAPEFTSYCVISETDGSAPAEVYFDSLNRKLRTVTLGFNGQPVYKDTVYNSLGQVEKVSRAYYADALQTYWALSTYDDMGRLIKAEEPGVNGVLNATSTSYNGLTTVATNPAGQSKTTVTNALGKVISVQEPEAASMSYQYDALGNLIKTTDSAGNVVTIDYDLLGRKIGMNDPDMGIWSYDYNGYGELVQQTDAKGQSSQMSYDILGRMVQRVEPEGTSTWTYDSANKGIGKLAQVVGADGFKKTYVYDNLGRLLDATTEADNKVLTISTEYDQYSRLKKLVRPQGFVTENVYTAQGYLQAVKGLRGQASDYQVSHLETLLTTAITDSQALQSEAASMLDQAQYYKTVADDYALIEKGWEYSSEVYDAERAATDAEYAELIDSQDTDNAEFAYYVVGDKYKVLTSVEGLNFIKVPRLRGSSSFDYVQVWFSEDQRLVTKAWDTPGSEFSFTAWLADGTTGTIYADDLIESPLEILVRQAAKNSSKIVLSILVTLPDELKNRLVNVDGGPASILLDASDAVEVLAQMEFSDLPYAYPHQAYQHEIDGNGNVVNHAYWNTLYEGYGSESSTEGSDFAFLEANKDYDVWVNSSEKMFIKVPTPESFQVAESSALQSGLAYTYIQIKTDDATNKIAELVRPEWSEIWIEGDGQHWFYYQDGWMGRWVPEISLSQTGLTLRTFSLNDSSSQISILLHQSDAVVADVEAQIAAAEQIALEIETLTTTAEQYLQAATLLQNIAETAYREALLAGYWAPGSDDEYYNDYQSLIQDEQHVTFWQAKERDAEGRLARELHGNGLSTVYNYDPSNGLLLQQQTGFANFDKLRDLKYQYDQLNNVTQRSDLVTEVEENFTYDALDRLVSSTVVSTKAGENLTQGKTYAYDALGNITHKSDLGDYIYDSARPHAVISAGGNSYSYDANGNMTGGAGRTLTWSSFNKPISMAKDGKTVDFTYAPDRARYLKTGSDGAKTLYLDKLYELITKGQEVTHKQFIYAGSSLVAVHVSGLDHNGSGIPVQTRYMHKDNLGSVDTITDGVGTVVDRMSFDPFGGRRQGDWREATVGINLIPVLTNRGFTGHEHIDEMDLIHMNGRVYDPTLGRFLSADPHIQSPYSTQSYNRYSYVSNNPLKYADPSGFFLKKLFKGIANAVKKVFKNKVFRMVAAVVAAWYLGPHLFKAGFYGTGIGAGAMAGAAAGFASGFIASGGDFKSALYGGVTGAAFGAVGAAGWGDTATIAAHGAVGGISSKIQGGKFGEGFISSAFAKFTSTKINGIASLEKVGKGIATAIAGGTASVLGGGKFANGASRAALAYIVNHLVQDNRIEAARFEEKILKQVGDELGGDWNVKSQVKIQLVGKDGRITTAVADYIAVNVDEAKVIVGEVKNGLGSRFSAGQKIVYDGLVSSGRVRIMSDAVVDFLDVQPGKRYLVSLSVHALAGSRGAGQALRMWGKRVGFKGAAGLITVLGSPVAIAAESMITANSTSSNADCVGCLTP